MLPNTNQVTFVVYKGKSFATNTCTFWKQKRVKKMKSASVILTP